MVHLANQNKLKAGTMVRRKTLFFFKVVCMELVQLAVSSCKVRIILTVRAVQIFHWLNFTHYGDISRQG